jgi:hypothetical protein
VAGSKANVILSLYTTKDLAKMLDIPQYQIMLAIDNGLIPCYIAADRWRFVSSKDDDLLSRLRTAASIAITGGLTLSQALRTLNGLVSARNPHGDATRVASQSG